MLHKLSLLIDYLSQAFYSFSDLITWLFYIVIVDPNYHMSILHWRRRHHYYLIWYAGPYSHHLARHTPPHLWHPSEEGIGRRLLDQFIQPTAQMLHAFEKPQATQRKLKVWGAAPVATWHTSFTQLPSNSVVFSECETIWWWRVNKETFRYTKRRCRWLAHN